MSDEKQLRRVVADVRFEAEFTPWSPGESSRLADDWRDAWETAAILVRAAGVNDPKLKVIGRAMSLAYPQAAS